MAWTLPGEEPRPSGRGLDRARARGGVGWRGWRIHAESQGQSQSQSLFLCEQLPQLHVPGGTRSVDKWRRLLWRSASPTSYSPSPAFGSGLAPAAESRHGHLVMLAALVGSFIRLKEKFAAGLAWPVAILAAAHLISCSAARGASSAHSHRRSRLGRRGYWRCSRFRSAAQSKDITGQQAMPQAIGRDRYEAHATLPSGSGSGWPSVCASKSVSLQLKPSRRITDSPDDEAPKRGRGGGARESRHVAKAPRKSGLCGQGRPLVAGKGD